MRRSPRALSAAGPRKGGAAAGAAAVVEAEAEEEEEEDENDDEDDEDEDDEDKDDDHAEDEEASLPSASPSPASAPAAASARTRLRPTALSSMVECGFPPARSRGEEGAGTVVAPSARLPTAAAYLTFPEWRPQPRPC